MYFFINAVTVAIAFLIHYELLYRMSLIIPKLPIPSRLRILFALFGALLAHVVEIWTFAFVYYYMINNPEFGELVGNFSGTLLDCVYYSFTTYTSLGFGDIVPHGPIRFLTGFEALTGLMLITWTASFLFIEMQRFWSTKG